MALLWAEKGVDVMSATAPAKRFIFTHWEGGGNTPPMLAVVRRLVARGHLVRVLSDLCNRVEVEAAGASFAAWSSVPPRPDKSVAYDPLRDWEAKSPAELLGLLRDRLFVGPAMAYARDVLAELKRFPADVIVANDMMLGAMAAAESAGVPCVGLSPNVYLYPRPGVPPFGPGFLPGKGPMAWLRDAAVRTMSLRVFGRGAPSFNATRKALGLPPIAHPFAQVERVAKHLVLTSSAFDFSSSAALPRIVFAGPELDDPAWAEPFRSPWSSDDRRPLVVVGFSSTFQDQAATFGRVIEALSALEVRAVVTTGPSIDPSALSSVANVHVVRSAPHNQLLPEASVMVTHAGHGTVIRALAAGVPLLCLPMGRDQNDNAARVVARGAGLRLNRKAGGEQIRKAVHQLVNAQEFRVKAQELGQRITHDARNSSAVSTLEEVAMNSER
ncbi:MAG TPA: glycosyltransferase [Candidatus Angelobacter sp.]|nr:glycosyltransferase [Candidatus Angelobacter sp.]